MNQIQTTAIVLKRTEFGEADRIITLLTPDRGKLTLMARGVRKPKSKLAGGIELFSISDVSYLQGRGEIGTLVSVRLKNHYGQIVKNIDRVQIGYKLIATLNKATEDQPEAEYFTLLENAFAALDNFAIDLELIQLWFEAQLLKMGGHTPNLTTDTDGNDLIINQGYNFDFDAMTFNTHEFGNFKSDQIKSLRLLFSGNLPDTLQQIQGLISSLPKITHIINSALNTYIRV